MLPAKIIGQKTEFKQMENPTDLYCRPRTRRCRVALDACQDCSEKLTDANWSESCQKYKRYTCRKCWTARQKKYQDNKPGAAERQNSQRIAREATWSDERKEVERRKKYNLWLKRNYNITLSEYDEMHEAQNGKCAICKTEKPRGRGGFHVDHCHATGKVRSLLCAECNMMLGLAKDNPNILKEAAMYVQNHKPENRIAAGGKAY